VRGEITDLPTDLSVTAAGQVVKFTADRPFGAKLQADFGWVAAVDMAVDPEWRHGVSVTDGVCGTTQGCRPVTEETCKSTAETSECYGFKVRYDHEGIGTGIVADTKAKLAQITDVRPTGSPLDVEVRLALSHTQKDDLVADIRQEGINVGTDLDFKVFELKTEAGKPIETRLTTAHSADLGKLSGWLSQPGKVIGGKEDDNYRLLDPVVTFTISNVPKGLDAKIRHGEPTGVDLVLSAPVSSIIAFLVTTAETEEPDGTWKRDSSATGLVVLTNLPLSPAATPLSLLVTHPKQDDRGTQGAASPTAKPPDVLMTDCEGNEIGGGLEVPPPPGKPGEEKKGLGPAQVDYTANATGAGAVLDISLPIIRVANETVGLHASLDRVQLGLLRLGKKLTLSPAKDNRRIAIGSPEGKLGELWVEVDFKLHTDCRQLHIRDQQLSYTTPFDTKLGFARLDADVEFQVDAEMRRLQVRLSDLEQVTLTAGNHWLAYGVQGKYGMFRLTAPEISLEPRMSASITAKKWPYWFWIPPLYDGDINLPDRYTHLWSHLGSPDRFADTGACLQLQVGLTALGHASVHTKPGPEKRQKDGVTINGGDVGEGRMSFTMLDPGPAGDERVGWIMDVVTAKYINPYPGGDVKLKELGPGAC
jgi:hypothetical protein